MCTSFVFFCSSVLSWCSELINKQSTSNQAQPDRSPIYSLNDDVLYYLAHSILPTNDAAALVLTCKAIFQAVDGKRVLRELKDRPAVYRTMFLQRFEPDFPNRVLCYRCATFHSRYPTPSGIRGIEGTTCDKDSGSIWYGPRRYILHYRQAKEIVNQHLFGPSYGRSLDKLVLQGPFFESKPEKNVTGVHHLDLKWVRKNGTFALILRRNVRLEYQYTNPESRETADWMVMGGSTHIAVCVGQHDLTKELPPSCYMCELCGAERQFSITYLPHKPGYALYRGTLWESVALCQNSEYDLWTHISMPWLARANFIPISQRDLKHQYAFIDDIPSVPAMGFHDSFLGKLPDES